MMNTGFHYDLAKDHGAKLQRDAQLARLARAARVRGGPASTPNRRRSWLVAAVAATSLVVTGAAYASAAGGDSGGHPKTPNDCVRVNGGDYNACSVGNSGRGESASRPVSADGHRVQSYLDCRPSRIEHYC